MFGVTSHLTIKEDAVLQSLFITKPNVYRSEN